MTESQMEILKADRPKIRRNWPKAAVYFGFLFILAILPLFVDSPYTLHIFILSFIYIIATVSLRAITISGQFPLAHAAYMGIGAYLAGMASRWLHLSPWIAIPSSGVLTMLFGMLIGIPFARLRMFYYSMGSLFFGIGILYVIIAGGRTTGGYSGLTGVQPIFIGSKVPYYYMFLGLATVCLIAMYRFEFSRVGDNVKAVAQSHIVASSVGINEAWYRILAVGVGCFFVGIAGAGYAFYNMVVSPTSFNFMATLWLVMYVIIGGIHNFAGPIVGTFILILLPEYFRGLKTYSPLLSAAILLLVVYFIPDGLISLPGMIKSWYTKRRER